MKNLLLLSVSLILIASCSDTNSVNQPESQPVTSGISEPAYAQFDQANSDSMAIVIARQVLEASGGEQAWKNMGTIQWNFFGRRLLTWNKQTGDVRIEITDDSSSIYLVNILSNQGKVRLNGVDLQGQDLEAALDNAKSIWINDSYWLFMPFKLMDPGVSLEFLGTDTLENGTENYVLRMTFDSVGDTPENMYDVYVDRDKYLVSQWAFYATAQDSVPAFSTPWSDYNQYGNLLLSGNRGRSSIVDIELVENPHPKLFEEF